VGKELIEEVCLEIGEGWQTLIGDLCEEIDMAYKRAKLPMDVSVNQVKSKYGKLCFYYFHEDYKEQERKESHLELHKEVRRIVNKYEEISKVVCERCGKQGNLHDVSGWSEVLCDNCM
jgi:hypothetical protein